MIHSREEKISVIPITNCKSSLSMNSNATNGSPANLISMSPYQKKVSKKRRGRPKKKITSELKNYSILPKPVVQAVPTVNIDLPLGMRKKTTKKSNLSEVTTACSPLSLEQLLEASTQTNVPFQASTQTNTTFQDSKQTNTVCSSILNTSQMTQTQLQKDFNSNSTQTADLLNDLVNEDIFINYLNSSRRQSNCSEKCVQTNSNKETITSSTSTILTTNEGDTNDSFQLELDNLVFEENGGTGTTPMPNNDDNGVKDTFRDLSNTNNVQDIALSPIPEHFFDELIF